MDERQAHERITVALSGATVLRAWELTGGVSASVWAADVKLPDNTTRTVVVRAHSAEAITREADLLPGLSSCGLPVPTLLGAHREDPAWLVQSHITGQPVFESDDPDAYLSAIATLLARVHTCDERTPTLRDAVTDATDRLARMNIPPEWVDTLAALRADDTWQRGNPAALIHGDYWPGNLLWRAGRVVGLIDWEDAAVGDPLEDVANARLELRLHFGDAPVEPFTAAYRAAAPALSDDHLPYWDAFVGLRVIGLIGRWGLAPSTEKLFRARLADHLRAAADGLP